MFQRFVFITVVALGACSGDLTGDQASALLVSHFREGLPRATQHGIEVHVAEVFQSSETARSVPALVVLFDSSGAASDSVRVEATFMRGERGWALRQFAPANLEVLGLMLELDWALEYEDLRPPATRVARAIRDASTDQVVDAMALVLRESGGFNRRIDRLTESGWALETLDSAAVGVPDSVDMRIIEDDDQLVFVFSRPGEGAYCAFVSAVGSGSFATWDGGIHTGGVAVECAGRSRRFPEDPLGQSAVEAVQAANLLLPN